MVGAGNTAAVSVRLASKQTGTVHLSVTYNAKALAVEGADVLDVSATDWNTLNTLIIAGINTSVDEGQTAAHTPTIAVDASATTDSGFLQAKSAAVAASVTKDDVAGIALSQVTNKRLAVTEANADKQAATYAVALTSQPSSSVGDGFVTVPVTIVAGTGVCRHKATVSDKLGGSCATSGDCAAGDLCVQLGSKATVSPATLGFPSTTWRTPHTVAVTAVDDSLIEGAHTSLLRHSVGAFLSSDAVYGVQTLYGD